MYECMERTLPFSDGPASASAERAAAGENFGRGEILRYTHPHHHDRGHARRGRSPREEEEEQGRRDIAYKQRRRRREAQPAAAETTKRWVRRTNRNVCGQRRKSLSKFPCFSRTLPAAQLSQWARAPSAATAGSSPTLVPPTARTFPAEREPRPRPRPSSRPPQPRIPRTL